LIFTRRSRLFCPPTTQCQIGPRQPSTRPTGRQGCRGCGGADGHRLRQIARAFAADLSRPSRDHQRRRAAQHHYGRGSDLVVHPRRHRTVGQGKFRQADQHRAGCGIDDRHHHGNGNLSARRGLRSPRNCRNPWAARKTGSTKPLPLQPGRQNSSSNDIGDITWVVPTGTLRFLSVVPGVQAHHWSAGITPTMSIAHKGAVVGAKVMAASVLDLLTSPELVAAAKKQFAEDTKDTNIFLYCRPVPNRRSISTRR